MDIPDIGLVVQWRANCSLSALWQRFGRGARDGKLVAVAVFLVEQEHFDEPRQQKLERSQQLKSGGKKRKVGTVGVIDPTDTKRPCVETKTEDTGSVKKFPIPKRRHKKGTLESWMDDFVNAPTRNIKCRREPLNQYFGNSQAGKCPSGKLNIVTYLIYGISHQYLIIKSVRTLVIPAPVVACVVGQGWM